MFSLSPPQVLEGVHFLHEKGVGEEVRLTYQRLAQSLEEFIGRQFSDWLASVSRDLPKYLEVPLMSKSRYISPLPFSLLNIFYFCSVSFSSSSSFSLSTFALSSPSFYSSSSSCCSSLFLPPLPTDLACWPAISVRRCRSC